MELNTISFDRGSLYYHAVERLPAGTSYPTRIKTHFNELYQAILDQPTQAIASVLYGVGTYRADMKGSPSQMQSICM